jgi:SulP family sulfate permease
LNGLAIVIGLAQIRQSQIETADGKLEWMNGMLLSTSVLIVCVTMVLIWLTPKITRLLPGPLAAIMIVSLVVIYFDIPVPAVGDLAPVSGGLPPFVVPKAPLNFETLYISFPYAIVLSAIGLIESLVTLNLVGEISVKRGGTRQECLAQGAANTITGFFGGMGGCAMIGQSMINVKSGGRTRIAATAASLFLLFFILYGSALIEAIPIAALVGVMFMVVIGTFAWSSITLITKIPKADALVIVLVTVVTVLEDLAVAVLVGVIVSALVFAWNSAIRIRAVERPSIRTKGAKVYDIEGPLFFGSVESFVEIFRPDDDPKTVILDFAKSKVVDQSALKAIEDIAEKYQSSGREVKLRHFSNVFNSFQCGLINYFGLGEIQYNCFGIIVGPENFNKTFYGSKKQGSFNIINLSPFCSYRGTFNCSDPDS